MVEIHSRTQSYERVAYGYTRLLRLVRVGTEVSANPLPFTELALRVACLLYTSDAADE